jgi:Tol biopolymer transport system component
MYPFWWPDGKSFYFPREYSAAQDRALIQRDLATGKERVLFRSRYMGGVTISPDGRYMAAADADPSSNSRILRLVPLVGGEPIEVMRIPSETTPEQLVGNNGVLFSVPSWAPDSRSFLVWKKRQGLTNSELWQVFVDGRQPRAVQAPPVAVAANTTFAVDADGTVAFRYREQTRGGVWALDNFLPVEQKK